MKSLLRLSTIFFLLNLCLKSVYINSIPPLLTDDETYYATQAQAYLIDGSDITGRWHLFDFAPAYPIYSELTGVTYAVGFLIFPHNTQLAVKTVPILMGSLLPILLGLIAFRLFQKKIFFTTTVMLSTFNPWIFQFSRMSFDSLPSVFFYLLGIVIILYSNGWKILFALVPLSFGFFQYQGHKPLLVPLILTVLIYTLWSSRNKKKHWKRFLPLIFVLSACIFVTILYLIRLPHLASATRIDEMTINTKTLYEQVYTDRRLGFENRLSAVFVNKVTAIVASFVQRFFASFDFIWLFVHGNDRVDSYAVTQFGFLYLVDAVLILVGIVRVWSNSKMRPSATFLTMLVLIGTLPNILKNDQLWLTFRGSFMIIGLLLFSSIGCVSILLQKNKAIKVIVLCVYIASVTPFLYHYFWRYPILTTRDSHFYNRVVANYIKRERNRKYSLYSNKTLFDSIIVYDHLITKENLSLLHKAYTDEKYQLQGIAITDGCFDASATASQSGTVTFVDSRAGNCERIASPSAKTHPIEVNSIIDSRTIYRVYNDTLCSSYSLRPFVNITTNIFDVEALPDKVFCESFFTRK